MTHETKPIPMSREGRVALRTQTQMLDHTVQPKLLQYAQNSHATITLLFDILRSHKPQPSLQRGSTGDDQAASMDTASQAITRSVTENRYHGYWKHLFQACGLGEMPTHHC